MMNGGLLNILSLRQWLYIITKFLDISLVSNYLSLNFWMTLR